MNDISSKRGSNNLSSFNVIQLIFGSFKLLESAVFGGLVKKFTVTVSNPSLDMDVDPSSFQCKKPAHYKFPNF